MHPMIPLFGYITIIVAIGVTANVITVWLKSRSRQPSNDDLTRRLSELAARLERIETAVDSMAIEVERISEGQRFTTKLLAERAPSGTGVD